MRCSSTGEQRFQHLSLQTAGMHGFDDVFCGRFHIPAQVGVNHILSFHGGDQFLIIHDIAVNYIHPTLVGIIQATGIS